MLPRCGDVKARNYPQRGTLRKLPCCIFHETLGDSTSSHYNVKIINSFFLSRFLKIYSNKNMKQVFWFQQAGLIVKSRDQRLEFILFRALLW